MYLIRYLIAIALDGTLHKVCNESCITLHKQGMASHISYRCIGTLARGTITACIVFALTLPGYALPAHATEVGTAHAQLSSNQIPPPPDMPLAGIDAYLKALADKGYFSGSVLIAQQGRILIRKGYNLADREAHIPNAPQTRFRLASLTKQFTAMAILILQSQGKLTIQDRICAYILACPAHWRAITIHQLLTHTSSIP
jgi:CubicO group peptidase (beta-lactamase class C family)